MPSVEELMRPYAEYPCPGVKNEPHGADITHDDWAGMATDSGYPEQSTCPTCHGTGLDPRFKALRGEHEWWHSPMLNMGSASIEICTRCRKGRIEAAPYCLRTDLGALVRVAAACGLMLGELSENRERATTIPIPEPPWLAPLTVTLDPYHKSWVGQGDTPHDALAVAIVAAMPLLTKIDIGQ